MSVDFFSLRELVRWYDGHLGTGTLRRHWPGGDTYWDKYTQPVILVGCMHYVTTIHSEDGRDDSVPHEFTLEAFIITAITQNSYLMTVHPRPVVGLSKISLRIYA